MVHFKIHLIIYYFVIEQQIYMCICSYLEILQLLGI